MNRAKNTSAYANVVVLEPKPRARSLELSDGAVATVEDGALELRDAAGRLLVRYADGSAEIAAPAGDLVLSSAMGRVVVKSALDFEVEASRDVVHRAGRALEMSAGTQETQLRIEPGKTSVVSDRVDVATKHASLSAETIATAARSLVTRVESAVLAAQKYELSATRLVEKTKNAFRDVEDLAQTRVGRARTVVASLFSLNTGRTVLASRDDTSIDGRKVLLG